ncbi:putative membrane protein [Virgibacillus halotolerans]|uniref:YibE/F family protein n=1 Tax=Virgibacillus halotolerans TaxID=1071053 RepID=UPI001961C4DF|nr:YibE/F family protein [Virgibacillus halotolerans]MBM7599501.1 putative membrane protein [Virgibacillus halotolerans]
MTVQVLLAGILFLLMVLIGGKKGARSFFTLFMNFGVFLIIIIVMTIPTINPVILTLIACTAISSINLFYINGVNSKTKTAFLSSMITIAILLFFIVIVTKKAMIQGFGEEEIEELSVFSLNIGVDFVKIGAAVIIMSTIGSITDIAISIASPMREVFHHHPSISKKDLFRFGLSIGRDVLGTDTNTLFFAFFGSYLGLLIWFKDLSYSFGEIVNSKVFSAEVITILCAGIGVALIIPITAWINAYYLVKAREKDAIK